MKKTFILSILITLTFNLKGSIRTVTSLSNSGTGSLRTTILTASAGDTIKFSTSLLTSGNATINLTSVVSINKPLTIIGMYNSTDTLFISNSNFMWGIVFDIDLRTAGNQKFVFDSICFNQAANTPVKYQGNDFLFTNSIIKNSYGSLQIESNTDTINCSILKSTFINNNAPILVRGNSVSSNVFISLTMDSCNLINNKGGLNVDNYSGTDTVSILNSNFIGNHKSSLNEGGAFFHQVNNGLSKTYIENCTFQRNKAKNGGSISLGLSKNILVNIQNSTFLQNEAVTYGGAIYSSEGGYPSDKKVKVNNCIFHRNISHFFGAAIYMNSYEYSPTRILLDIENSTILENSAFAAFGSVVYVNGGIPTVNMKGSLFYSEVKNALYSRGGITSASYNSGGYNMYGDSVATSGFVQSGSVSSDITSVSYLNLKLNYYYQVNSSLLSLIPETGSVLINAGNPGELTDAQNRAKIGIRDIGAAEHNCQVVTRDTFDICSNTFFWKGKSYIESGLYNHYLQKSIGCDSIWFLYLIMPPTDTISLTKGVRLAVNTLGARFQWLNCSSGFSPILGQQTSVYSATTNGSYALEITKNGCVDTTDCVSVFSVGLNDTQLLQNISIFPNPTNGTFTLDLGKQTELNRIFITDINGRLIKEITPQNVDQYEISFEGSAGVYLLNLIGENKRKTLKIIKE